MKENTPKKKLVLENKDDQQNIFTKTEHNLTWTEGLVCPLLYSIAHSVTQLVHSKAILVRESKVCQ